ncbi:spore cortex biosynthesis protein YabQ [Brevibacillus ruminantium]|uniref:Spore cortex biosynthesis protein YabQ n=1 Tax=Brevibacillus ruminantium TaxID=2950604 RepID=A0ABY4WIE0_9BACL|nr:spore cortex biosynthesis protein YabQ [Brevibacillus ruminantium]USG65918.1 spore cortex biosynthesis protein YabQ [Brevibacillus ruminantium]
MSIAVQFQTVLAMTACGAILGMGFDTYHVFSRKGKIPVWLSFFLDILFWVGSMALVFWILIQVNDGIVRFPIFLGMLFGAWVYFVIGSKKYIQFLNAVIKFLRWLYRTIVLLIYTLIVRPVLLLYKLIFMVVTFLMTIIMTIFGYVWKLIRFLSSPFARWGQHLGKGIYRKWAGFWGSFKKWLFSGKKKQK